MPSKAKKKITIGLKMFLKPISSTLNKTSVSLNQSGFKTD